MFSRELCELFKNSNFVEDLGMADSKTPVRGSLINKVASLTARTHLIVLETGSHRSCFVGEGVLRNFAKFTGNTYARVSILIKLQAWPVTLLKKGLWTGVFL